MPVTFFDRFKRFVEEYIPFPINVLGSGDKANEFDNLCNMFYTAIKVIASEAQKPETEINKKKLAIAIADLWAVNQNINDAYNAFKSRKANNLSSKEKTIHNNLDNFLSHRNIIENIPNEQIKAIILSILRDIEDLGDVDTPIPDQYRIDRLTNKIIPIFLKATSEELIDLLIQQFKDIDTKISKLATPILGPSITLTKTFSTPPIHPLTKPTGEHIEMMYAEMALPNTNKETVYRFEPETNKKSTNLSFTDIPDITNDVREHRQQKTFAKRTHTERSMRDNYNAKNPLQKSADLINALGSKTKRLFSEFDAKNKYTEEYEPKDVSNNISDKKEIFQKKGLIFTSNNQKANFSIKQNISSTQTINILDVDCQSNANKEITKVTLTQHSNLNRSKVMVTEELSILGRALHADYVGVSSIKQDGSVNIENVKQGAVNALYANLLPTYDNKTLAALESDTSSESKILLEIYHISSNKDNPNRKWDAFQIFEKDKKYLIDPFARIRTARSGDAPA